MESLGRGDSDGNGYGIGSGSGSGYGNGDGNGSGYGSCSGNGDGYGSGDGDKIMTTKLIKFQDVQGDTSFIRADSIDGLVTAEHEVPAELDEQGQPVVDAGTKLKFFAVAILRNGRQVLESFDTAEERDEKIATVTKLM